MSTGSDEISSPFEVVERTSPGQKPRTRAINVDPPISIRTKTSHRAVCFATAVRADQRILEKVEKAVHLPAPPSQIPEGELVTIRGKRPFTHLSSRPPLPENARYLESSYEKTCRGTNAASTRYLHHAPYTLDDSPGDDVWHEGMLVITTSHPAPSLGRHRSR